MKQKRILVLLLAVLLLAGTAAATEPLYARSGRPAYVLICASPGQGILYDSEGNILETLRFDQRGQAKTGLLLPGDYSVQAGSWTVRFTLRTNAAVGQVSGDGWSDGEILHLGSRTTGALTVLYQGAWQWTLEGETAGDAVPSLTEIDGGWACVFDALPLGSYILRGPEADIPLLLTQEVPEQVLDLRPSLTYGTDSLG